MERVRDLRPAAPDRSFLRRVPRYLEAVKFHESVFALPFAYSGMVLAADGWPSWSQFAWVTVAMVAARTLGMSANRLIDRHIDARNPRTAVRHLPSGLLKPADMAALAIVAAAVLFYAASRLNTLALALAPVAAAYLVLYPYAKRFTWAGSMLLGWALAIAPSGAWIAVRGSLSLEPVLLSGAVAFWAAGFDILYHTQDRRFYEAHGLHSVAQRFGILAAFWWARAMDVLAVASLLVLGAWMGLGFPYYVGCVVAAALLAYRYRIVTPDDLSKLGVAFQRINAYVSTVMFVSTLIAVTAF